MRRREKSIPTFVNFDGNLLCLRESTAQGERRIFDILIRNLTVYMPHAHNVTRSLIYNVRENMAENQTPHPDYIFLYMLHASDKDGNIFAVSLVIILDDFSFILLDF